ncbi:MAG: PTS sugar transporter subunit IIA [Planctomycetota bacterium]
MVDDEPNEIMTLADVAEYLQVAEKTVLRMVQRGEIPAAKVASQWRFMRGLIRDWLVGRMQAVPGADGLPDQRAPSLLPLREVLRAELMSFDVEPGPKEAVLRQLLAPLVRTGFASAPSCLLKGLVERERMMTTAIGHGIAIPHPRRPIGGMFAEPAVAMGICPRGTDFDAIDDQKVHVFFLICATREEIHLNLMAKVAWLSRQDVSRRLGRVKTSAEAWDVVTRATERVDRTDLPHASRSEES